VAAARTRRFHAQVRVLILLGGKIIATRLISGPQLEECALGQLGGGPARHAAHLGAGRRGALARGRPRLAPVDYYYRIMWTGARRLALISGLRFLRTPSSHRWLSRPHPSSQPARWPTGSLAVWQSARLGGWEAGRLQCWKAGRGLKWHPQAGKKRAPTLPASQPGGPNPRRAGGWRLAAKVIFSGSFAQRKGCAQSAAARATIRPQCRWFGEGRNSFRQTHNIICYPPPLAPLSELVPLVNLQ